MTRAQHGLGDGRPDEPRPNYGRTDARGTDARGTDGRGVDGRGVDGRGVDGRGTDGRGVDGRGYGARTYDGRGIDGRGIDGRDLDGWGSDIRVPERPPQLSQPRPRAQLGPQPQIPAHASAADLLPPINPYAVVALVAALLGLFPVAIVFGFLAMSRPSGRGMAISALLLGAVELLAVVGLVVAGGHHFSTSAAGVGGTPNSASIVASPPAATADLGRIFDTHAGRHLDDSSRTSQPGAGS